MQGLISVLGWLNLARAGLGVGSKRAASRTKTCSGPLTVSEHSRADNWPTRKVSKMVHSRRCVRASRGVAICKGCLKLF